MKNSIYARAVIAIVVLRLSLSSPPFEEHIFHTSDKISLIKTTLKKNFSLVFCHLCCVNTFLTFISLLPESFMLCE